MVGASRIHSPATAASTTTTSAVTSAATSTAFCTVAPNTFLVLMCFEPYGQLKVPCVLKWSWEAKGCVVCVVCCVLRAVRCVLCAVRCVFVCCLLRHKRNTHAWLGEVREERLGEG